jgi:hypothetical protein
MGFRPDVERWIAAADLCVLPSMREGLPRVVVQYVAAGKPVVVTHLDGIEEIVEDGVNGYVVGSMISTGMGHAIGRLLTIRPWPGDGGRRRGGATCRGGRRRLLEPAVDQILQEIILRKAPPRRGRGWRCPYKPASGHSSAAVDATLLQRN